ncbi:hypothetical protein OZ411_14755 [Bradyrhizobium sp. Arg237L]|uniref:hypothetical protein n=1 Tax=Bradyrhizobium sp. Arg237L TaxID=3003352 RepID=UPI00249E168D|nr:hypothetical protein [Bradyrhizobium sp. Arg237L]MDI4234075.1 hypothetical protein [Bradyrhizobium sp. Arg237L]
MVLRYAKLGGHYSGRSNATLQYPRNLCDGRVLPRESLELMFLHGRPCPIVNQRQWFADRRISLIAASCLGVTFIPCSMITKSRDQPGETLRQIFEIVFLKIAPDRQYSRETIAERNSTYL